MTAVCAAQNDGSLLCPTQHGEIQVFFKDSSGGSLSPQSLAGDTYDLKTCRAVEYEGQPSAFCEGKETNFVIKAILPQPRIDGQLLLLRVLIHLIVGRSSHSDEDKMDQPASIESKVIRPGQLRNQLIGLQNQVETLPVGVRNSFQFALNEHWDNLEEAIQSGDRHSLTDLAGDIECLESDIREAADSAATPSAGPATPNVSVSVPLTLSQYVVTLFNRSVTPLRLALSPSHQLRLGT